MFIPLYFGQIALAYRQHQEYTNLWYYTKPYPPVNHFFLYPLANFDGVHYLNIAGNGYTDNGRFLPLYPFLIRLTSQIFGQGEAFGWQLFFAGVFLSHLFLVLSLIVFYKLVRLDFSPQTSFWSGVFLLLFPTAFFFTAIYSESLFLFLSLLSFYLARKKHWFGASICGMLLTVTRLPGISIFFALLIELFTQKKEKSLKIIYLFFIPLGILSYAWYNWKKWADPLYFIHAHAQLGNSRAVTNLVFIPQTLYRYAKILLSVPTNQFEWWVAFLEVTFFFIVSLLLFEAWRKKIRLAYIVFSLLCFLLPVFSGTFSGLPRYAIILFPIFIALALFKSSKIKIALVLVFSFLSFLLLMFFSRGYFIA